MKKIIFQTASCFALIVLLFACKSEDVAMKEEVALFALKQEAVAFAKKCYPDFNTDIEDILIVEKVKDEKVLLRLTSFVPNAPLFNVVDRYQLTDTAIESTFLTCGFQNSVFKDSTFATASGYWLKIRVFGGIDGNPPYSFFLTDLKIIENQ
jgi:hypothetical protein